MKFLLKSGLVLAMAVSAYSAQAETAGAKLVDVQGQVLVNGGTGYKKTSEATFVGSGSSVLVRQGSTAALDYGNGCRVQLNAGTPVVVSNASPCVNTTAQAAPTLTPLLFFGGAAAVVGGTAAILSNNDSCSGPSCS